MRSDRARRRAAPGGPRRSRACGCVPTRRSDELPGCETRTPTMARVLPEDLRALRSAGAFGAGRALLRWVDVGFGVGLELGRQRERGEPPCDRGLALHL